MPHGLWKWRLALAVGFFAACPGRGRAADEPAVEIPVASKAIDAGTKFADRPEAFFAVKKFPADLVPKAAVRNLDALRGRQVYRKIPEGFPVTDADLDNPLQRLLPAGNRAVAIRCPPSIAEGGLVEAGNRVDLLCTVTNKEGDRYTKTILHIALILSVGTTRDQMKEGEPRKTVGVLWVAMTPEDAERVVWVLAQGEVYPVVRKDGDAAVQKTGGAANPFGRDDDPTGSRRTVLVAVRAISKWTVLNDPAEFFKKIEIPRGAVVEGAIDDLQSLRRIRLTRDLPAHGQVTEDHLGERVPEGLPIFELLPKGHRALTVEISSKDRAVDFLNPGCRVDVIATETEGGETVAKVVGQNLRILDVGGARATKGRTSVTLDIGPDADEAERMAERTGGRKVVRLAPRMPDAEKEKRP